MAINNNDRNRNISLQCAAITGVKDNYKSLVLATGAMFYPDTLTIAFTQKFRAVKLACLTERS